MDLNKLCDELYQQNQDEIIILSKKIEPLRINYIGQIMEKYPEKYDIESFKKKHKIEGKFESSRKDRNELFKLLCDYMFLCSTVKYDFPEPNGKNFRLLLEYYNKYEQINY